MKPAAAAAFALLLAGCAGDLPLAYAAPPEMPSDYRQAAANAAVVQLQGISLSDAQISELRETKATQLGNFFACIQTAAKPTARPGEFAVLFEGNTVLQIRRAVAIDRCATAAYGPLPRPKRVKVAPDAAPKT